MRRAGLADSTAYSFKVRACNDVGCGAWSPARRPPPADRPNSQNAPSIDAVDANTIEATWGTPNGNGLAIDSYDADIDPGGVEVGHRHEHEVERHPRHQLPGSGPRLQRGRAARRGARAASPSRSSSPGLTITASYHGDAQGQSGCSSSRCTYVRVVGTGLSANTDYTVTCRWSGNPGGFSASTVRTNSNGTLVDDPACYYG